MSREKKFIRVCLSLDQDTIDLLEKQSKSFNMNKSTFIKFMLLYFNNTYGFKTEFLRK